MDDIKMASVSSLHSLIRKASAPSDRAPSCSCPLRGKRENRPLAVRKCIFLLLMPFMIVDEARAEILDKAGGPFTHWYYTLLAVALALLLAWQRPWLAFLAYPFSLLLAWGTLDLLHGELGTHVLREGGMPFLVSVYASMVVDLSAPVIAFLLFRKLRSKAQFEAVSDASEK